MKHESTRRNTKRVNLFRAYSCIFVVSIHKINLSDYLLMKIYRGPKGKKFRHTYTENIKVAGDDDHKFVDSIDLSNQVNPWSGETYVAVNVTKKGDERQSVVHIVLEENDVIALFQGLMKGLREKRELWEEAFTILNSINLSSITGLDIDERDKEKIKALMKKR